MGHNIIATESIPHPCEHTDGLTGLIGVRLNIMRDTTRDPEDEIQWTMLAHRHIACPEHGSHRQLGWWNPDFATQPEATLFADQLIGHMADPDRDVPEAVRWWAQELRDETTEQRAALLAEVAG